MKIAFNVERVLVLNRQCGTDRVIFYTDLSPSVYPYKEKASLIMDVASGQGEQYVIENFGLIPEVIVC